MNDEVWKAALAGLLHDIGKFAQRAQVGTGRNHEEIGASVLEQAEFEEIIPYDWWDDVTDAVAYHGGGDTHKRLVRIVRVADWLAAAERAKEERDTGNPDATPLIPIASRVELDKPISGGNWGFLLEALSIQTPADAARTSEVTYPPLFPRENVVVNQEKYKHLWEEFRKAAQSLPKPADSLSRLSGLMGMLRQYTSHIPSATPWEKHEAERTVPDVSLYDHSKVTAAIASCLCWLPDDALDELHGLGWERMMDQNQQPAARLLRGDMSGIQSFIYRITSSERERTHENVAKRLRGRSFYVSLMADVIAEWILRQLGLTAANALFVGGGRFDLLMPIDHQTEVRLVEVEAVLQEWLLRETGGVLGVEMAWENLIPADFKDLKRANGVLDERLAEKKLQKNRSVLSADFFAPQSLKEVCEVCGLTPMDLSPEKHICDLCEAHRGIGAQLPKTGYIARLYGVESEKVLKGLGLKDKCAYFGPPIAVGAAFLSDDDLQPFLDRVAKTDVETIVYSLNETAIVTWGEGRQEWPHNLSVAQMYLANAAPLTENQVYEFDQIAELSAGAKLLGVLKADVDHLGLLFGLGLEPMTISRVASLSHAFDRFFAGYLNTICYDLTSRWKGQRKEANEEYPKDLQSLFYVVYAGGDDLLIIGPWDQTVELAKRLNDDFRAYMCHNPNITLSAGVVMVKPHFPVQQFAGLADQALKAAKNSGRDRITVFESQPVRWTDGGRHQGLDKLLELAYELRDKVEGKEVPSTLLYDIDRLWNKKHKGRDGKVKPMITPDLLYLLTRRLPKEVRDELKEPLFEAGQLVHIPVSFVSLSLRKE